MEREELIDVVSSPDSEYRKGKDSAGNYENYSPPGYSSYSPGSAQSFSGGGGGGGLLSILGAGLSALGDSMFNDAMSESAMESTYQQSYQQAVDNQIAQAAQAVESKAAQAERADKIESIRTSSDVLPKIQADKIQAGTGSAGLDKIDITQTYPEVQEWIQISGSGADRLPGVQADKRESSTGKAGLDRVDITREYPEVQMYEEREPDIRTVSQDAVKREAQRWNEANNVQSTERSLQTKDRSFWDSAKDVGGKILDQVTETMEWHHTPQGILSDLGAYVLAGPMIAAGSALAGGAAAKTASSAALQAGLSAAYGSAGSTAAGSGISAAYSAAASGAAKAAASAAGSMAPNVLSMSAYKAAGAAAGAAAVLGNVAVAENNGAVTGSNVNSWNPQTQKYNAGTTFQSLKQSAAINAIKAQTAAKSTQAKLESALSKSQSQPVAAKKITGGGTGSW